MSNPEIVFEDLGNQIQSIMVHHPHLHQRKVHFRNPQRGHVVLEGEVQSWFEKQLAQEALRSVVGITSIDNQLIVQPVCME